MIISQNYESFHAKAKAQETTEQNMTVRMCVSNSSAHVWGEKTEYYGYLESQKKTEFLVPLCKQKIISIDLLVPSDFSEQSEVQTSAGTAKKLPVTVRVFFNKKAFTSDPTLETTETASKAPTDDDDDGPSDDIAEIQDEDTIVKKNYLKGMFEKLDNGGFDDDDEDDDTFLFGDDLDGDAVPSQGSSKRQKTEVKQDISAAKKKQQSMDDEDLADDDDDLSEYLVPQSKELEEESKKVLLNAQLGKLYDSISTEVSEEDNSFTSKDQYAEQPKYLKASLRPYQLLALKWMLNREQHGKDDASSRKLHPMYVEKTMNDGSKFYFNAMGGILTFKFIQAPPDPKGGILADVFLLIINCAIRKWVWVKLWKCCP